MAASAIGARAGHCFTSLSEWEVVHVAHSPRLVLLASVAVSAHASAATWYVATSNCSGINNGTSWNTAFKKIEDAVSAASAGDEIRIAGGTYRPASTLVLPNDITILGEYQGCSGPSPDARTMTTTITGDVSNNDSNWSNRGDNLAPIFSLAGGYEATLDGLVIKNGGALNSSAGGGCVIGEDSLLKLQSVEFDSNGSGIGGGAINSNDGSLQIIGCTFEHNKAAHNSNDPSGGAIYAMGFDSTANDRVEIEETTFSSNGADLHGGAIYVQGSAKFHLSGCTISENSAGVETNTFGGGIYAYFDPALECNDCAAITDCTFDSNQAATGGGIYIQGIKQDADFVIDTSTFSNNLSLGFDTYGGYGGGAYLTAVDGALNECTFSSNQAEQGGGLYINDAPEVDPFGLWFRDCNFLDQLAIARDATGAARGGAVANHHHRATFVRCLFRGNTVENKLADGPRPAYGGAIWSKHVAEYPTQAVNCVFLKNGALSDEENHSYESGARGGAVSTAPLGNFTNCLFNANYAQPYSTTDVIGQGGALYADVGHMPQIRNCTIVNNTSTGAAGGLYFDGTDHDGQDTVVLNSILYGNSDDSGSGEAAQLTLANSAVAYVDYSDIQGCSGSGFCAGSGHDNISSSPVFVDPDGTDNVAGTIDDNFRLSSTFSPCFDAGLGTLGGPDEAEGVGLDFGDLDADGFDSDLVIFDLDLNDRFLGHITPRIDMGCYESPWE